MICNFYIHGQITQPKVKLGNGEFEQAKWDNCCKNMNVVKIATDVLYIAKNISKSS